MLDEPEFVEARWDEPPGTVPVAWDHACGPLEAAVVLVFYGAYLCPRSRRLWAVVRDAAERFRSPLRVVCRQLPGRSARSLAAALLTERAADAGEFWEVHERMMSSTDIDDTNGSDGGDGWHHPCGAASGAGALAPWDRIGEHARMARVLRVGDGPAIFLNGRRYTGRADTAALLAALASLAEQSGAVAPGSGGLAEASQILSVVSHELRGALSPLVLALHPEARLAPEAGLPDEILNRLEIARRQASVLARHLEHLAAAHGGRASLFQLRPLSGDLVRIVRAALSGLTLAAARSAVALRLDADDEIVGHWDPLRIEQIVNNLVGNAIKYGGSKPITVVAKKIGPFVRLAVRDHGDGLARDELARLFKPHARLERHRRRPGLGLGLYIVRALAEAHRGRVFVVSDPGDGSTFGVDLPLALLETPGTPHSGDAKRLWSDSRARWSSYTTDGKA